MDAYGETLAACPSACFSLKIPPQILTNVASYVAIYIFIISFIEVYFYNGLSVCYSSITSKKSIRFVYLIETINILFS